MVPIGWFSKISKAELVLRFAGGRLYILKPTLNPRYESLKVAGWLPLIKGFKASALFPQDPPLGIRYSPDELPVGLVTGTDG
jgi:hypothetical protein